MKRLLLIVSVLASSPVSAAERVHTAPRVEANGRTLVSVAPIRPETALTGGIDATLSAARACMDSGATPVVETRRDQSGYFRNDAVDGRVPIVQRRTGTWICNARPVTQCSFTVVWAPGIGELGYATVQCQGSFDDPLHIYVASTTLDVTRSSRRATVEPRGRRSTAVLFDTTAFPSAQVSVWGEVDRRTGAALAPPIVNSWDPLTRRELPLHDSPDAAALQALSLQIRETACAGAGVEACPGP